MKMVILHSFTETNAVLVLFVIFVPFVDIF